MEAQDAYAYPTDVQYDDNSINQPPTDPYAGLDEQQRAQLEEEFRQELTKTEEEIATLRQVLANKTKHAQELKRKLGISAWKEWTTDLGQGVKNLQETTAYVFITKNFLLTLSFDLTYSHTHTHTQTEQENSHIPSPVMV